MTAGLGDLESRVCAYVRAVAPGMRYGGTADVCRLNSGENHDVYLVTRRAATLNRVVVRVATSERARDCTVASREAAVMSAVGGTAAPAVHDFRCVSDWFDVPSMCMQFVAGAQRPPATSEDARRLGRAVGSVHELPRVGFGGWPGADLSMADYLAASIAKIDARLSLVADPLPAQAQDRLQRARAGLEAVVQTAGHSDSSEANSPLVVLHGDVAGGNILWTPRPVLIDWEYTRLGDPADEVAYIFNQNDLTPPRRQDFWRGYREARGSEAVAAMQRVDWWEPVAVLASALFWAELWFRRAIADAAGASDLQLPNGQAYYGEHAMRRVERVETLLQQLIGRG